VKICVESNKKKGVRARILYHVRKFNPEIESGASKGQFTDLKEIVESAISKVNSLRYQQQSVGLQQAQLYDVRLW